MSATTLSTDLSTIETHHCFGGVQGVYRHRSHATGTDMTFAVFVPANPGGAKLPVLTYLSGLTCSHSNAMEKAGAQQYAAQRGIVLVMPDTSPRGDSVANDDAYDLGQGAGFYLDATQLPWSEHFSMETYITEELPAVIAEHFPVDVSRAGIFGHSMGGHGALTLALRHPELYRSVSAFSPIGAPTQCAWGKKAFAAYLGDDESEWRNHDACALLDGGARFAELLIDQGLDDSFLEQQLGIDALEAACHHAEVALTLRKHEGYDHSYYFISTFMGDHLAWHAERL